MLLVPLQAKRTSGTSITTLQRQSGLIKLCIYFWSSFILGFSFQLFFFVLSCICSPANVVILLGKNWKSTLTRGGRMLQNLIWLDDSILRGRMIGMQSTSPIQPLAQNSLSSDSDILTLPQRFTISSITVGWKRRLISWLPLRCM